MAEDLDPEDLIGYDPERIKIPEIVKHKKNETIGYIKKLLKDIRKKSNKLKKELGEIINKEK